MYVVSAECMLPSFGCKFSFVLLTTDRCILQPETGLCRARIPSYFYNTISGNCEQFIYGGCDGNDNRFKTAAACAQHCYYNGKSRISNLYVIIINVVLNCAVHVFFVK